MLLCVLYTYFEAVIRHGTMASTETSTRKIVVADPLCFPFHESFSVKVGILVLDEVHQIRNTDTQTYKTMESLQAEFKVTFHSISPIL